MHSNLNNLDPQGFDKEIIELEKELLDFLVNMMINSSGRDPILSRVMTFFFTRKMLTQQDLQILTNFSAGTISKTVRQLKDMKIITQKMIPGTHKHIYIMEKLPYGSPSYLMNTEQMMGGKFDDLQKMKDTLDNYKEKMQELEGFDKVYSIISQLLGIMTTVPRFMKILEKELEEYMKEFKNS
jgi:DNA-binding transcriptional regulator GbsR (MarR family)